MKKWAMSHTTTRLSERVLAKDGSLGEFDYIGLYLPICVPTVVNSSGFRGGGGTRHARPPPPILAIILIFYNVKFSAPGAPPKILK